MALGRISDGSEAVYHKTNKTEQCGHNMLVLTRKSEEKITIGKENKIIITILKIQGDKVSIGIEADKETPILRNELLENPEGIDDRAEP